MTSETKLNHTPGPWIWGPNARRYADPNLSECQRVMNVQLGKTTALCWDERDARLISAAPELLACLLDVLDADGDLDAMDFKRYRAAIERATG